ncbi:hypothetical protein HPP92_011034 [Vanilla planifolia]|uniref:Pentatricopeptide repeat-containing protein n=1 Tax=Vanilla planifolia TaxID=51239 RepID=A0A835V202_VANPL|nr:hypothetical protein HPP92_011034 [Vanilla planifolia]
MICLARKSQFLKSYFNCSTEFLTEASLTVICTSFSSTPSRSEKYISSQISQVIRVINSVWLSNETKWQYHATAIKSSLIMEAPVATSFISFYLHLIDLDSARTLFFSVPTKDPILWCAMVSGLCKAGEFKEAISTFRAMQHVCGNPNIVAYLSVMPACANTGSLQYGKQIHGNAIRREMHFEASLLNSMIDIYVKCSKIDDASSLFDTMKEKDVTSWKNLILGCIENRELYMAIGYFSKMLALQFMPGEVIVCSVIALCQEVGSFKFGAGLHCYCIKSGLLISVSIGTAILKMYADFKEFDMAHYMFSEVQSKDHVAWSAMISACSYNWKPTMALELFKQMVIEKIQLNEMTFVCLLQAFSMLGALEIGRSMHGHLIRLGYSDNLFVISSLMDFYSKLGNLSKTEILFSHLQKRDLVCWSSMINGYGINGFGEEAIHTFSTMLEHGFMPNEVVFVSLLSACRHCGLLDEGWKWFHSMSKFGITANLAHYACVVDLLGCQGQVERALHLVRAMPMEADASIWVALLRWCGTSDGDLQVAEIAAEKLVSIDPIDNSYYITASNMYSMNNLWDDAKRIRGFIEDKSLRKTAGYSMV